VPVVCAATAVAAASAAAAPTAIEWIDFMVRVSCARVPPQDPAQRPLRTEVLVTCSGRPGACDNRSSLREGPGIDTWNQICTRASRRMPGSGS
jgi:hypothetical protein